MANRSVQLYLYADLPGIGWRYCRAVFGANNNLKPHVLLRPDGTEEIQVEADYYLSYRSSGHKMWENVGNNPSGAIRALEKKRTGKPIYQMLEMCKRIAVRAGIPREEAWLHKWRATYCVELLREGVDLPSIQATMGHKEMETTARYCAPMKKTALRERLDRVNSFNLKRNGLVGGNGAAAAA